MGLNIDQNWVDAHKSELLKILEADFDPHLKRVAPKSLEFVSTVLNQEGDTIVSLMTEVLEYGGCSGVNHEYPQPRRLKIKKGDVDPIQNIEAML